jgi:transposase
MMLGTVDPQGSLLGVDSLLAKLFAGDENSFYARLARHGDEVVRDEDFAACYADGRGRPSIPPSLLMKAVLLQIRDDVSDREAARRAAKDLDWKRALALETEDIPFHHTTLSVFRSRLLLNDADETVLKTTIARAVERGLFAKKVLAIADSTGVMGAAAVADTYELIRQAVAKLVEAAGGPKALHSRLRRGARAAVRGKAPIDWADATARRAELGRLVALARDLLAVTADHEEAAEARELLGRIIDQDVEDTDDGPAIRQGVAPDRVVSVVDPEMRHGRKSRSKRLDGYKAHVVTDHHTELVLGVSTNPGQRPRRTGTGATGRYRQRSGGAGRRGAGRHRLRRRRHPTSRRGRRGQSHGQNPAAGQHRQVRQDRLHHQPHHPIGHLPRRAHHHQGGVEHRPPAPARRRAALPRRTVRSVSTSLPVHHEP